MGPIYLLSIFLFGIFKIILFTTHEIIYGFTNFFVMGPIVLIALINLLLSRKEIEKSEF